MCVCVCVPKVINSSGSLVQLTLYLIQSTGRLCLIDPHRVGIKHVIHVPGYTDMYMYIMLVSISKVKVTWEQYSDSISESKANDKLSIDSIG